MGTVDILRTKSLKNSALIKILRRGGVGVLPTDTLYGIVGSAFQPEAIQRIYRLRKRNLKKPMIILIASTADVKKFGIRLTSFARRVLRNIWPRKVSVVLPCGRKEFAHLHRGKKSLAFRVPDKADVRRLLKKTGPLVAPSANVEGEPPAKTIREAQNYFHDKVDFYIDKGRRESLSSTLIAIQGNKVIIKRPGAVKIKSF